MVFVIASECSVRAKQSSTPIHQKNSLEMNYSLLRYLSITTSQSTCLVCKKVFYSKVEDRYDVKTLLAMTFNLALPTPGISPGGCFHHPRGTTQPLRNQSR